jgi:hypothetical protein
MHTDSASALIDWETLWAPYDESTYGAALACLEAEDVVLDIGAGDLRFARRAAKHVRRVFAVERNREVLQKAPQHLPVNLTVICADALAWDFPEGITTAVLLMRHCRHFKEYLARLRVIGCQRLITNARWGMGVECLPLTPQRPYWSAPPGWYACACGAVGFKTAPAEEIPVGSLEETVFVENCPSCLAKRVVQSRSIL